MINTTPTQLAKTDRTFELELIDGELPKTATGITDARLYKGGNKLHIQKNPENNFWFFTYEQGLVPEKLRCNFTNFQRAFQFAEVYYKDRNLTLKEIDG